MVRIIQINNIKVWLFIQKLAVYTMQGASKELIETNEYLCYFKLSPPTDVIHGELMRDEQRKPKLFLNPDEAEVYAINFLSHKLHT